MTKRVASLSAFLLGFAALCQADAQVERKTTVKFGGAIGGVLNRLGGKATKEGVVETTTVKGSRRASRSANAGEIVDLHEEKIYQLDLDKKTYRVVTFDELRRQARESSKTAGGSEGGATTRETGQTSEAQKAPEYEVDFDVKETGTRETISGFDTRQVLWTVTVRPKGKKLEEGGGAVLVADMWMGPRIAAVKEVEDFELRYGQKLYGSMVSAADMRQMAAVMAATPAMGAAMKKLQEKRVNAAGTAIRAILTFDVVGAPGQAGAEAEDRPSPGRMMGGLLGRIKKKKEDDPAAGGSTASKDRNRKTVFTSTTEIVKAAGAASSTDVAIPAGFKASS